MARESDHFTENLDAKPAFIRFVSVKIITLTDFPRTSFATAKWSFVSTHSMHQKRNPDPLTQWLCRHVAVVSLL
jgi:hypothetical protein